MTETAERFFRIPYSFLNDPVFLEVHADDCLFATWTRLWMWADNSWPAPAAIPRSCNPEALARLMTDGLVVVVGDLYRMAGMDEERVNRPGAAGGRARASLATRGSNARFTKPSSALEPAPERDAGASTLDPATDLQRAGASRLGQHAGPPLHSTSLHDSRARDGADGAPPARLNGTDPDELARALAAMTPAERAWYDSHRHPPLDGDAPL